MGLSSQSPSPAQVSYCGPLTKADTYYKTEGSWIDAKESQRKSRISNRLNERIAGSKLQGASPNLKNCLKKVGSSVAPKCYPDEKQNRSNWGFLELQITHSNHKETEQPTKRRIRNTGYAWSVKPRAESTERYFPSLITKKCSNTTHYL